MSNVNEQMLQSGFAAGGMKQDPVSGNEVPVGALPHEVRDDVPAQLSEGEFVIPADVVRFIGLQKLMQLRDKAKEGLARMAEMGQMGNSDEAAANGENPLGSFSEGEDDDGFEAEIDDIMGGEGEVEMATGGSVPSALTPASWQKRDDPNTGYMWNPTERNTRWNNYDSKTGAFERDATPFTWHQGIAPEIAKYLQSVGYQGWIPDKQYIDTYSKIQMQKDAAQSGRRPDQNNAPIEDPQGVYNRDPKEAMNDLKQWLDANGVKFQLGVHKVPGATQQTYMQRLIGPDGKPLVVDAHNDRYNADDRLSDAAKITGAAALGWAAPQALGLAKGSIAAGAAKGAVASGANTAFRGGSASDILKSGAIGGLTGAATAGAKQLWDGLSFGGDKNYLDPDLGGTKPVVTTPGIGLDDLDPEGAAGAGSDVTTFMNGVKFGDISGGPNLIGDSYNPAYETDMFGIGAPPTNAYEGFGGSSAFTLPTTTPEVATPEGFTGKDLAKDIGKGFVNAGMSGAGGAAAGLAAGAALGSALSGDSDGGSSSASRTAVPSGNNPVVDYRPVDGQMEELFINNRPTGRKRKKPGMAVGGVVSNDEVNLDAYNFFNQKD